MSRSARGLRQRRTFYPRRVHFLIKFLPCVQQRIYRVLPQYEELELEANQITQQIKKISNANTIDKAAIRDLESAMQSEAPPSLTELESIYAEAGTALPGIAIKRYDEVRSFHESVIRNRREYLADELDAAKQRLASRDPGV